MRKLIDVPDHLIDALKQAAARDHRTVKSCIEHTIITTLAELEKPRLKRTRYKK